MKVGTDGVLLGAWANCRNAHTVLDVGTGSGLIASSLR
jgi:tRNA1Val (adenine37-N6)-methyltransferase